MRLLEHYIGRTILAHAGGVMLVLLAVYTFSSFVGEMDSIGRGSYTFGKAVIYTLLLTPRQAYELFPMVALMGTMLGLGALAGTSELTVMRAAGISIRRLTWSVLKTGLIMVVVAVVLGEVAAPPLEKYARIERAKALARNLTIAQNGLWVRDENTYINVQRMLPDGVATGVSLYRFDNGHQLVEALSARTGEFIKGRWLLKGVQKSLFEGERRVVTQRLAEEWWRTSLTPDVVSVAAVPPENLSALDLYNFVVYLRGNGLESGRYELAFWVRVMAPFATAGMVLMALPFVFGSLRAVSIGQRILVGSLLGIGFYIFNAVFNRFGAVYDLSPFLSAAAPPLIVFVAWGVLMRRLR